MPLPIPAFVRCFPIDVKCIAFDRDPGLCSCAYCKEACSKAQADKFLHGKKFDTL